MKAFIAAIVVTVVIAVGADYILNNEMGYAADEVFSVDGVSLPEEKVPGRKYW